MLSVIASRVLQLITRMSTVVSLQSRCETDEMRMGPKLERKIRHCNRKESDLSRSLPVNEPGDAP